MPEGVGNALDLNRASRPTVAVGLRGTQVRTRSVRKGFAMTAPQIADARPAGQPAAYWTGVAYEALIAYTRAQQAERGCTQPRFWLLRNLSKNDVSPDGAGMTVSELREAMASYIRPEDDLAGGGRGARRARLVDLGRRRPVVAHRGGGAGPRPPRAQRPRDPRRAPRGHRRRGLRRCGEGAPAADPQRGREGRLTGTRGAGRSAGVCLRGQGVQRPAEPGPFGRGGVGRVVRHQRGGLTTAVVPSGPGGRAARASSAPGSGSGASRRSASCRSASASGGGGKGKSAGSSSACRRWSSPWKSRVQPSRPGSGRLWRPGTVWTARMETVRARGS